MIHSPIHQDSDQTKLNENCTIVIPARMNSSRLPQKMMRDLGGMPLIERTWRSASINHCYRVIVATDDQTIFAHMKSVGAEVVMTSQDHPSGTDRLSEVISLYPFDPDHIIINWQGDEPFLPLTLIDQVKDLLIQTPNAHISTIGRKISSINDFTNPNVVKIVCDAFNFALYFSRATIPFCRDYNLDQMTDDVLDKLNLLKHFGVYAYRVAFLRQYPQLAPTFLESTEKLEQLRALFYGFKIVVGQTRLTPPPGIDTKEDLDDAKQWLQEQNKREEENNI